MRRYIYGIRAVHFFYYLRISQLLTSLICFVVDLSQHQSNYLNLKINY